MYDMSYLKTAFALALGCFAVSAPTVADAATQSAGPKPAVQQRFVVVVDPGHGGTNDGCLGYDGDVHEKEITLQMAEELAAELTARLPHAKVHLTRTDDRTMTLAERVSVANAAGADLFVSLHANASPDGTQSGFETYVLDAKASSLEAARTARRENDAGLSSVVHGEAGTGSQVEAARMLRQLHMTANRSRAAALAHAIQRAQAGRFPTRSNRGVKQAPFDVLMGVRMPAVLFEAGFLDHAGEGAVLTDPQQRSEVVLGLADAIVEHYRVTTRLK
ncbi:MAG: N-acetylmuramoyl-L-alanine amidase [Myxococcota bacterium]